MVLIEVCVICPGHTKNNKEHFTRIERTGMILIDDHPFCSNPKHQFLFFKRFVKKYDRIHHIKILFKSQWRNSISEKTPKLGLPFTDHESLEGFTKKIRIPCNRLYQFLEKKNEKKQEADQPGGGSNFLSSQTLKNLRPINLDFISLPTLVHQSSSKNSIKLTGMSNRKNEIKTRTDLDAQISSANDVLDLARNKHGFELWWQIRSPVRDMKIP